MTYRIFETAKAGVERVRNEDSVVVKKISPGSVMVALSDGASTGVFSKEWSDHITRGVDSAWLSSPEAFESGLRSLREGFRPDIERPTALRKFLLEGSYATLLAAVIERRSFWFRRTKLTLYAVGDVSLFIYTPSGELEYLFPEPARRGFGNTPDMLRSSQKLQDQTPYILYNEIRHTSPANLLVFVSDALGEHMSKLEATAGLALATEIGSCGDQAAFDRIVKRLRDEAGMKNDDVTICLMTQSPGRYFSETTANPSPAEA